MTATEIIRRGFIAEFFVLAIIMIYVVTYILMKIRNSIQAACGMSRTFQCEIADETLFDNHCCDNISRFDSGLRIVLECVRTLCVRANSRENRIECEGRSSSHYLSRVERKHRSERSPIEV